MKLTLAKISENIDGPLTEIKKLCFKNQHIRLLDDLSCLVDLEELDLGNNELKNSIFIGIKDCKSLKTLKLQNNKIEEIKNLKNLQDLKGI